MTSPSTESIEMGAAFLKTTPEFIAISQREELDAFGERGAQAIGASGLTADFQKGYELGLATARVIIRGSVAAIKGGEPDQIL